MSDDWCVNKLLDPRVCDRIMASMNFVEGDRVPIWDYLDNRGIFEHFNPPDADYHAGMVKAYHELGIDLCLAHFNDIDEDFLAGHLLNFLLQSIDLCSLSSDNDARTGSVHAQQDLGAYPLNFYFRNSCMRESLF